MTHPLRVAENCTTHPLHKAQNLMTHPLSAPAHPPILFDQSLRAPLARVWSSPKNVVSLPKKISLHQTNIKRNHQGLKIVFCLHFITKNLVPSYCYKLLASVVQNVDKGIHRTNLYPVDSANWIVIYPVDSAIQSLNNLISSSAKGISVFIIFPFHITSICYSNQ